MLRKGGILLIFVLRQVMRKKKDAISRYFNVFPALALEGAGRSGSQVGPGRLDAIEAPAIPYLPR